MALEDFVEPEVGVAVALTALVASPKVRQVLRRGAVYGLAGLLMAGDAASSLAQGVKRGAQKAAPTEGAEAVEVLSTEDQSPAEAPVAAGKYAAVPKEDSKTAAEEAPSEPKRSRKTAEATGHE